MAAMPLLIDALRARGDWLGASWLVWLQGEGFLFGGQHQGGSLVISAIGGKIEPGESFLEAALREFTEETGTPPPLPIHGHHRPWLLSEGLEAGSLPQGDSEGAWVVIQKVPDGAREPKTLWIATFLGITRHPPAPVEKLEVFPVFTPEELAALARGDLKSGEVRLAGGKRLPREITISLKDTPRALAARPELVHLALEAVQAHERGGTTG